MSKSAYEIDQNQKKIERYVVVAWVDNEAGVLARVSGLFSGRGYNIESLAVSEVDHDRKISRITIATLVKFLGEGKVLETAKQICIDNKCQFLDKTSKSFIVQALGRRTEIDDFIKKIKVLGQVSISRTGALAMKKGSETVKDNKGQVL